MASMNKVILLGNLGKDPNLTKTTSGHDKCSFSVATSEKFKKKSGEWKEKTEWHNIVVWGKGAESCMKHLKKGNAVCIEGKIQTNSWDENGVRKYFTQIVATSVHFLDQKNHEEFERLKDKINDFVDDNENIDAENLLF